MIGSDGPCDRGNPCRRRPDGSGLGGLCLGVADLRDRFAHQWWSSKFGSATMSSSTSNVIRRLPQTEMRSRAVGGELVDPPAGRPRRTFDPLRAERVREDTAHPADRGGAKFALVLVLDQPFQALVPDASKSSWLVRSNRTQRQGRAAARAPTRLTGAGGEVRARPRPRSAVSGPCAGRFETLMGLNGTVEPYAAPRPGGGESADSFDCVIGAPAPPVPCLPHRPPIPGRQRLRGGRS